MLIGYLVWEVGIAVGLYGYGKRITHAIGTKLCSITPSRGVSIELASALVIITGSQKFLYLLHIVK